MSKLSYKELDKAFNRVSLRERIFMFATLLLCTGVIGYFWIVEPAQIRQGKVQASLHNSIEQERSIEDEIQLMSERLKKDPQQEIQDKINFAQSTLAQLDKQLDDKLVKFIHAQKMPLALTKVLNKSPGVKITSLTSLPVQVFNEHSGADDKKKQGTPFYRHSLQITLQGNYNAIYQYLLNVETLQDKFYWHSIDYKVSEYPLADVTLHIYTLSDQRDLVSG